LFLTKEDKVTTDFTCSYKKLIISYRRIAML